MHPFKSSWPPHFLISLQWAHLRILEFAFTYRVDYSNYIERTEGKKLDADLEEKFLLMCGQIKSGAVLMTENVKSVFPPTGNSKISRPQR